MQFNKITALIIALLAFGAFSVNAQWDDVYYDPNKDIIVEDYNRSASARDDYRSNRYNDDEYAYYNDYDFYYTSRIRRFHRPFYGFGFYDPVYIDALYYDPFMDPFMNPFMSPGMTMLIYDDFYSRRAWAGNRFWNNMWGFSPGWGAWGNRFGFGAGFNRFGFSPWGFNSFGFSPWGFNSFGFNSFAFGGGFFCPPTWGNNFAYNNVTNVYSDLNSRGTSFVPRRSGSSINPSGDTRGGAVIGNGRNTTPVTIDGRRPYPYAPVGADGIKPSRKPEYNVDNTRSRTRTRATAAEPYVNPRSSRINSNNSRTRSRTNSITPSSHTRTRTINSGSSTRTRSYSPSTRTRSGSSISPPSSSSSSARSSSSGSSRSRSSSSSNTRSRGNN